MTLMERARQILLGRRASGQDKSDRSETDARGGQSGRRARGRRQDTGSTRDAASAPNPSRAAEEVD